jgi:hypothetical protein
VTTGGGSEFLKFVSWLNGYTAMNPITGPKKFPIDHIWFNDFNVLKAASFIDEAADKGTGVRKTSFIESFLLLF